MADSCTVHDSVYAPSVRSRASSVFSTGTKFSIATLPHEELQNPEFGIAGPSFRNNTRPRSLMTLASHEQPAPPYDGRLASGVRQLSPSQLRYGVVGPTGSPTVESFDTAATSSPNESEDALRIHYGRIVQTIDQNHALELSRLAQAHERELAAIRHEIDQAYRKEWKAKNREVEKVREEANTRVATLEDACKSLTLGHEAIVMSMQKEITERIVALTEAHEIAVDKARNEVEDLWEGRWADRTRLAAEEGRRANAESQRQLELAIASRDKEWAMVLGNRHPELWDELKDTISGLTTGSRDNELSG